MENKKEALLLLLGGIGWAGFGAVLMAAETSSPWICWAILVAGLCMVANGMDKALEPRKW